MRYEDAREALTEAFAVHWRQGDGLGGNRSSNVAQIITGIEAARILAAADRNEKAAQDWLRFAYDPVMGAFSYQSVLFNIWHAWCAAMAKTPWPAKAERYRMAVCLAVEDYRQGVAGQEPMSTAIKMRALNIDHDVVFRRDWKPRFEALKTLIAAMDNQALTPISDEMAKMKKERREERERELHRAEKAATLGRFKFTARVGVE